MWRSCSLGKYRIGWPGRPEGRPGRAAARSLIIREHSLGTSPRARFASRTCFYNLNRHGAASCRCAPRPVLRTRSGHPRSNFPLRILANARRLVLVATSQPIDGLIVIHSPIVSLPVGFSGLSGWSRAWPFRTRAFSAVFFRTVSFGTVSFGTGATRIRSLWTAFEQSGFFQQAGSHVDRVFDDGRRRGNPFGDVVIDFEAVLGDCQFVPRHDPLRAHPHAVHLCAVTAPQVTDHPVPPHQLQLTMPAGYIGESQGDIATRIPSAHQ